MLIANFRKQNSTLKYLLPGLVFSILLLHAKTGFSADWPQFRGIHRDGISPETGLLKQWPQGGPKQVWMADGLGAGWSSAAIANGLVYITGTLDKTGYVFCFDLNGNGKNPTGRSGRNHIPAPARRRRSTRDGSTSLAVTEWRPALRRKRAIKSGRGTCSPNSTANIPTGGCRNVCTSTGRK